MPRSWLLNTIFYSKEFQLFEEWLIIGFRAGKFKMNLKYLVLEKQRHFHKMIETLQKDSEASLKGLPLGQTWDNLIIKI